MHPRGCAPRRRSCKCRASSAPIARSAAIRLLARWLTGVPEDKKASLIPAGWFEAWAEATFATDPKGGGETLRAPNGVIQDGQEFFAATPPKPYWDPAKLVAPTLLVLGEWDKDTPPYMAQTLFPVAQQCGLEAARHPGRGNAHHPDGKEPALVVPHRAAIPRGGAADRGRQSVAALSLAGAGTTCLARAFRTSLFEAEPIAPGFTTENSILQAQPGAAWPTRACCCSTPSAEAAAGLSRRPCSTAAGRTGLFVSNAARTACNASRSSNTATTS